MTRITAILAHRGGVPPNVARGLIITLAALGAVAAPLAAGVAGAQLAEAFDVASIRIVESPRNDVTAAILIRYAYGLKDFQLSGGPGWTQDRQSQC